MAREDRIIICDSLFWHWYGNCDTAAGLYTLWDCDIKW